MPPVLSKKDLRQKIMALVLATSTEARQVQSSSMTASLVERNLYKKAQRIGIFLSMPVEICTLDLIRMSLEYGKSVFVPKVIHKKTMHMTMLRLNDTDEISNFPRSNWGIPEPALDSTRTVFEEVAFDETDLIIVPGVAFGPRGQRLGHGGGFYDKYLGAMNRSRQDLGVSPIKTLGIGLECQLTDHIPCENHDIRLDEMILGRLHVFAGFHSPP